MARALAEEVHLDERYVAERLRDAVAGALHAPRVVYIVYVDILCVLCGVCAGLPYMCCAFLVDVRPHDSHVADSVIHTYKHNTHTTGVAYTDALMGPAPLTPPDSYEYPREEDVGNNGGGERAAGGGGSDGKDWDSDKAAAGRRAQQCCVVS